MCDSVLGQTQLVRNVWPIWLHSQLWHKSCLYCLIGLCSTLLILGQAETALFVSVTRLKAR
jgi:hypothetical protein